MDVRLRLRLGQKVVQLRLFLQPLAREIIPEDTVPRLRGRESRRRLEVRLFKRDKQHRWLDLVPGGVAARRPPATSGAVAASGSAAPPRTAAAQAEAPKGTLLNPLSPEELARLPQPSGGTGDNRPSTWRGPSNGTDAEQQAPASAVVRPACPAAAEAAASGATEVTAAANAGTAGCAANTAAANGAGAGLATDGQPAWVVQVEERATTNLLEWHVHIGAAAAEGLGMEDLALEVDPTTGALRLQLLRNHHGSKALELQVPAGANTTALEAKWRRRLKVLELRLPLST